MKDKTYVCITGASSGIGRATARLFAKKGFNLILVARRQDRLEKLREELKESYDKIEIIIKQADLEKRKQVYQLYDDLKPYFIKVFINNAGFGDYSSLAKQDLNKVSRMLALNVEALTILSTLYLRDYQSEEGCQLIDLSSRGGYMLVPNAVTYCASKYYVSAFTEGLALELQRQNLPMRAKVLAPAATQTEFGALASGEADYNYDEHFKDYHTSQEMAQFLYDLYTSDKVVGVVDVKDFSFHLSGPLFKY